MKRGIIFLINQYKRYISPILDQWGIHCKFYPTCSEYAIQAIQKYGIIRGGVLMIKRIFKCNPFSKGGIDLLK